MWKKSNLYAVIFTLMLANVSIFSQSAQDGINWPSFRGENAIGISEGYSTPVYWDLEKSKNITFVDCINRRLLIGIAR